MNKVELKKKTVGRGQNAYMYVIEELKVLQRLQHPNIIYLHEIIDDPKKDYIYLITQYYSTGSLADQLENANRHYESRNEQYLSDGRP
jgi:serine/threonine protein kinase